MFGVCVGGLLGCVCWGVWGCADLGGEKVSLAALLSGYLGKSGHLPRSMIDKDQDGFVSKEEGYGALPGHNAAPKTLDRLTCHTNFGGHHYTQGHSPRSCDKCMQYGACQNAHNQGKIVVCQCTNGKCEVHTCMWGDCNKFGTSLKYVCEATP